MALDHTSYNIKKELEGNPGANIPGLGKVISALSGGWLSSGAFQSITAAATLLEGTSVVFASLSAGVNLTIPQAANSLPKVILVCNRTGSTHALGIVDDADSPTTVGSLAATKSGLLVNNGTAWELIAIN